MLCIMYASVYCALRMHLRLITQTLARAACCCTRPDGQIVSGSHTTPRCRMTVRCAKRVNSCRSALKELHLEELLASIMCRARSIQYMLYVDGYCGPAGAAAARGQGSWQRKEPKFCSAPPVHPRALPCSLSPVITHQSGVQVGNGSMWTPACYACRACADVCRGPLIGLCHFGVLRRRAASRHDRHTW